jgi:hypothetical protein
VPNDVHAPIARSKVHSCSVDSLHKEFSLEPLFANATVGKVIGEIGHKEVSRGIQFAVSPVRVDRLERIAAGVGWIAKDLPYLSIPVSVDTRYSTLTATVGGKKAAAESPSAGGQELLHVVPSVARRQKTVEEQHRSWGRGEAWVRCCL